MCRKLIYSISLIILLSAANSVQAEPFSLMPTHDAEVGNDVGIGPDQNAGSGSGMAFRDIDVRRRVSFVSYDISEIRPPGMIFSNVSFSNYGHDSGTVNVYGVIEALDEIDESTITWNTAPGAQNDPTPPLGDPVALDHNDLTDLLMTFTTPARGVRASTETSQAVADFLNSDTDGIVTFLFAPPAGQNDGIARTKELGETGGTWLEGEIGGLPMPALNPNPADRAVDVSRDAVLSWTPGAYADKHDVYFGTNFEDVNQASTTVDPGGVYQGRQGPNLYPASGTLRLDFEQTYYWRIDEVNAPPDFTIYEGTVWSFTVEPLAYPIEQITATASSSEEGKGPENTVNGSGLDDSGLLHGNIGVDSMWLSSPIGVQPTWIEYEFDKVYKLHQMWAWNSNESLEPVIGLGLKDVSIEYSTNGADYTILGTTHEFARAPGTADYAHDTTVDFNGAAAKYIRLTANSNWGGILNQYGLSEVRFFYIPVWAREPNPNSGATGVGPDVVLSWRAGREAAKHDVYFSSDEQAVIDGTATVTTVTEASYGPLSLDLSNTYYWKVNAVNEAETPTTWEGNIWSFTVADFIAVDDFESYNDLDPGDPASNRIFSVWVDGWQIPTNGSLVGYENPPFCEQTIVHGGKQSMPFFYNNTGGAAYSEAELPLSPPQDWTAGGAKTLSLWFFGDASNTAAQMYVKVNGSKVTYDGDAGNLTRAAWQVWNIDLASLGVDLQNVTKLSIGIDGIGATGTLYVDDIRLYGQAPQPEAP